ncbi:hypothetical protein QTG54_016371, partial [Skeletonema marinoi]
MRSTAALTIVALATTASPSSFSSAYSPISLSTKSKLSQTPPIELYQFLASPANWPKIVASSSSVESPDNTKTVDLSRPLRQGQSVNEIFGLPPLFPLSVTWQCVKSVPPTNTKKGRLEFYSVNGVPGIATRCKMNFDIDAVNRNNNEGSNLVLEMEYEPQSPLALLATPILTVDNALALKVLLPSVLLETSDTTVPLDKFRSLMGSLYGVDNNTGGENSASSVKKAALAKREITLQDRASAVMSVYKDYVKHRPLNMHEKRKE